MRAEKCHTQVGEEALRFGLSGSVMGAPYLGYLSAVFARLAGSPIDSSVELYPYGKVWFVQPPTTP